jgi:hypothetical protein
MAISAPLPAEEMPSTKPTETPIAAAAILWRRSSTSVSRSRAASSGRRTARPTVAAPVSRSAAATISSTVVSKPSP